MKCKKGSPLRVNNANKPYKLGQVGLGCGDVPYVVINRGAKLTWWQQSKVMNNKIPLPAIKQMPKKPSTTDVPPVILPTVETREQAMQLFKKIINAYAAHYRPPGIGPHEKWARDAYVDGHFNKLVTLYYTHPTKDDSLAVRTASERELTNIDMHMAPSAQKHLQLFGYDKSFYRRYYEATGQLAPNIGVYSRTIVDNYGAVHFYHAVGCGLDSPHQPDFKVIGTDREALIRFYRCVFAGIFRCARDLKLTDIVMSVVGGGAFSEKYPGGSNAYQKDVFYPTFMSSLKSCHWVSKVSFMGTVEHNPALRMLSDDGYEILGDFPTFLNNDVALNSLIVNAWDPHSFPGNGNKGDPTLDGHIGRVSAIQFVGCGYTNPELRKRVVYITDPNEIASKRVVFRNDTRLEH